MYRDSAKDVLAGTISNLMKRQNVDSIKMSDILRESGVSRATFYRNFHDKYDLMGYCYSSNIERYFSEYGVSPDDYRRRMERRFQFYAENQSFMQNGLQSRDYNSLSRVIYRCLTVFYRNLLKKKKGADHLTRREEQVIDFFTSGSIRLLERWVEQGMPGDPVAEAHLHYDLIPEELKRVLNS